MSQPHTVALIGAGHVNLYVAAHAEMLIERGACVVLVDLDEFWYSGLATGGNTTPRQTTNSETVTGVQRLFSRL